MSDDHDKAIQVVEVDRPDALRMHPVVRAMLDAGPRPEDIGKLLSVQREWEAGEARKAYTAAMVSLKAALPAVIGRDQVVAYGQTRYTHTSLAAAVDAVVPHLTAHGFSHGWEPSTSERTVTITCRLTHCAGHSESATISAPPDTGGKKNPAQAVASTITLLQRYTLLSILGIATADMKDPRPASPDLVDVAKNQRAAAHVRSIGRDIEEAERAIGRPSVEWTTEDLGKLRQWLTTPRREPGEEG